MIYPHLPPVGALDAPELTFEASPNVSSRNGTPASVVFEHVWGGGDLAGVVAWLTNPQSQASAHLVYAGRTGPDSGKAVQLVPWGMKAWTECDFNPRGLSIETADQVWQGHDPEGFAQLARMTALLLHLHGWPARWVRGDQLLAGVRGHTRHADGGLAACGHLACPTTDLALYQQFHERVVLETRHGGFRDSYGKP